MRKLATEILESTYRTWTMMRNRCNNPNSPDHKYYGGRGIKHCERWATWDLFLEDMGEKPSMLHTLDRTDNNGDYTPDNCRWATRTQQTQNREYCVMSMDKATEVRNLYATRKFTQAEIAKQYGTNQRTISLIVRNESWVDPDYVAVRRWRTK